MPSTLRADLLHRVVQDGVLHRSASQTIVDVDGTSARWMLDSLGFSLTADGAHLAARVMLEELAHFEGRQLATYGTIGIPLMQAIILASKGKYRGLLVRKELKTYGARRRIEGPVDPREPVVMIDDSVSSGWSMLQCARHLADAGLEVEGGLCLVRFGWAGIDKVERATGRRVRAVFDVDADLAAKIPGEPRKPKNPTRAFPDALASPRRAPEGLDACALARRAIDEWLAHRRVLRAPKRLDRRWDHAGGTYVSLRRRDNLHDRPARNGFWLFPGERGGSLGEDVVFAAVQTAVELEQKVKRPREALEKCGIAVTFFGALEACALGELDNDRYGIVVRGQERTELLGGALPRMPGIRDGWGQFRHAAFNNARLEEDEPYLLWRHDVAKEVEEGGAWQPTGIPRAASPTVWEQSRENAAPLVEAARAALLEALGQRASPAPRLLAVPEDVRWIYLTAWEGGRLLGCTGSAVKGDAAAVLRRLGAETAKDDRFGGPRKSSANPVAVSLSFLRSPLVLGETDAEWAAQVTRFTQQALEVEQGPRAGLLLPLVGVLDNLTPLGFALGVLHKAGLEQPPYRWTRWDCTTWLSDGSTVRRLEGALPAFEPRGTIEQERDTLLPLLAGFLGRHHSARGPAVLRYEPFADLQHTGAAPAWLAHRAWVKARLGWKGQAGEDRSRLKLTRAADGRWWAHGPKDQQSVAEIAFALLADCALGRKAQARPLARSLWDSFDPAGELKTHREPTPGHHAQDYCPGQVLLALAEAVEAGVTKIDPNLPRALAVYRRRFRGRPVWGSVSWLAQAYCAWGRVLNAPQWTRFACEVVDWALPSQSLQHGGFLNLEQSDAPGALTAVYLEGVAAVFQATGDSRYGAAMRRGLHFLDRLTYQPRDVAVLPHAEATLGGLRSSLTASEVRLDFVQHALSALLNLHGGQR